MTMSDKHLEAAAEALKRKRFEVQRAIRAEPTFEEYAEAAVAAYLDSLLGDLPEEAMQAAVAQASWRKAIRAFLRSLRGGLGGGA